MMHDADDVKVTWKGQEAWVSYDGVVRVEQPCKCCGRPRVAKDGYEHCLGEGPVLGPVCLFKIPCTQRSLNHHYPQCALGMWETACASSLARFAAAFKEGTGVPEELVVRFPLKEAAQNVGWAPGAKPGAKEKRRAKRSG